MIYANERKVVAVTPPGALIDNASATTAEIDTLGYDYLQFYVMLGATDIALTALKLTESDTSGSGHADIDGTVYGTDEDIAGDTSVLPSATDDDSVFLIEVDLRGRKRYIDSVITVGDGTTGAYVSAWAELSRSKDLPKTATERGFANILRI